MKLKLQLIIIIVLFLMQPGARAQNWLHAWQPFYQAGSVKVTDVVSDPNGNLYATGYYNTPFSFGLDTLNPSQGFLFIAKFDAAGNNIWLKSTVSHTDVGLSNAITIDKDGNILITGYYIISVNWGISPFTGNPVIFTPNGSAYKVFVAKYDTSGSFIWAGQDPYTSASTVIPYSITSDDSAVYVTGSMRSYASPNPLHSYGGSDIYVAKFDSQYGLRQWSTHAGSSTSSLDDTERGSSIGVRDGFVYVTGTIIDTALFSGITVNGRGNTDAILAKYNTNNGGIVWAKNLGGNSVEKGWSLGIDNYLYVTGAYDSITYINNDSLVGSHRGNLYLCKLDTAGNNVWLKTLNGHLKSELDLTRIGEMYVAGEFHNGAVFGNDTLTANAGTSGLFVTRMDANGNYLMTGQANGLYEIYPLGLTHSNNNVFVGGSYSLPAYFGSDTLTYTGGGGTYLAAMNDSTSVLNIPQGQPAPGNLIIYPNPSGTYINILNHQFKNATLIIYDATGRIVYQQVFNETARINISHWVSNLFFAEIIDTNGMISSGKILKQ